MSWIIGLILIAYALIFFEVLVPGGVLGILGFCCIVGAAVAAHQSKMFVSSGFALIC